MMTLKTDSVIPRMAMVGVSAIFAMMIVAWAPQDAEAADDVLVVETEIGYDQIVEGRSLGGIKPSRSLVVEASDGGSAPTERRVEGDQIIRINSSLRRAIEENSKLYQAQEGLQEELGTVRGQRNIQANRLISVGAERDAYKQKAEEIRAIEEVIGEDIASYFAKQQEKEMRLASEIERLKTELAQAEERFQQEDEEKTAVAAAAEVQPDVEPDTGREEKVESLRAQVAVAEKELKQVRGQRTVRVALQEEVEGVREKSLAVIKMIDDLNKGSEELKTDKAKVHYNMGNIFFNQGRYQKAVAEYEEAIRLMPLDANAHFNLAFVSGEYLKDHKTAARHYAQYLRLQPDARDAAAVREKIVEAELYIRSRINSSLERELDRYNTKLYEP